jgi:hypothetical protein
VLVLERSLRLLKVGDDVLREPMATRARRRVVRERTGRLVTCAHVMGPPHVLICANALPRLLQYTLALMSGRDVRLSWL